MDFYKTSQYFDCRYVVNNPQGRVLRIGDMVIVHPTETSISREPFQAIIGKAFINWGHIKPCYELIVKFIQSEYKNGSAVINDYCFNRLEPVKWMWNKEFSKIKKPQLHGME